MGTKYGKIETPVQDVIIINDNDVDVFDFISDLKLDGLIETLTKHIKKEDWHQFYIINYPNGPFVAAFFVRPPESWVAEGSILLAIIAPTLKYLIYHFEAKYNSAPLSPERDVMKSVIQMLYAKQDQLIRQKGG